MSPLPRTRQLGHLFYPQLSRQQVFHKQSWLVSSSSCPVIPKTGIWIRLPSQWPCCLLPLLRAGRSFGESLVSEDSALPNMQAVPKKGQNPQIDVREKELMRTATRCQSKAHSSWPLPVNGLAGIFGAQSGNDVGTRAQVEFIWSTRRSEPALHGHLLSPMCIMSAHLVFRMQHRQDASCTWKHV